MADGDTIKPTPRNGALGALADALAWAKEQGNRINLADTASALPFVGSYIRDIVGKDARLGLGDATLGHAPEEVDKWAYGNAPMQVAGAAYPGIGSLVPQMKLGRSEGLLDALTLGQAASPLAKVAGKQAVKAGAGAVDAAMRGEGPLARALSPVAPAYAVKPKGGNFDTGMLPAYFGEGLGITGAPGATNDWVNKQLKNYITKEMGSPSDPLLALEKELPSLHLPEDALPQRAMFASPEHRDLHRSLTDEPLTPWGSHSDKNLEVSTVGDMMNTWNPTAIPEWMKKADPKTPMYGLSIQGGDAADALGFRHVLDYLDAAQAPHTRIREWVNGNNLANKNNPNHVPMDPEELYKSIIARGGDNTSPLRTQDVQNWQALHNAGLILSPEQVARTSVADAVRKTAQWNQHMAAQQTAGSPDLARGIAAVHKEYPEDGMRWVKLGTKEVPAEGLPEGWQIKPVSQEDIDARLKYAGKASKPFDLVQPADERGNKVMTAHDTEEEARQAAWQNLHNQDLSAGLNAEGSAMGHCVGGYCDDVASRGTEIYSLRDKNNNPHVTVEVTPGNPPHPDFEEGQHGAITQWAQENVTGSKFQKALADRLDEGDVGPSSVDNWVEKWLQDNQPRAYQNLTAARQGQPPSIQQIKGKQNAAPVEKYLPYVQDFVKSGQWGRVGDLGNTGLVDLSLGISPEPRFAQARAAREQYLKDNPGSRYITQEEYRNWGNPQAGYAHGGSVTPKYSKKAALLARLRT
jgi:PcfJ-like protein